MTISTYHKKHADQSDDEIQKKADAKELELKMIFNEVPIETKGNSVKIGILGCGDKRFVAHHKRIFEKLLQKHAEIITFDSTIEHLDGEINIVQHDCTQKLQNAPFGITYSHVLLKFIEPEKQFAVLQWSFDALQPGGLAIHIVDWDESTSDSVQGNDGLWKVSLDELKEKLTNYGIAYKEIHLHYGPALVLLR